MFLMVSPQVLRGPQPLLPDLETLRQTGLKTVVNLRSESDESAYLCKNLGLAYRHYPVEDWNVPNSEQMKDFLNLLADAAHHKVLVHCYQGVGRTGLFVCCYRVSLGMDVEDAIRISDQETKGNGMNERQRRWVRAFARQYEATH